MIAAVMKYQGYVGSFEFDEKNDLFRGKVSNVQSYVPFQGETVESTRLAFQTVVNRLYRLKSEAGQDFRKNSLRRQMHLTKDSHIALKRA